MLLRLLILTLLVSALPSHGATRWFTERAGAPVRWFDWNAATLERAKKEQRPIFLSICFAASWDCHRMQQTAFASPENVATLSAYFVPAVLDPIEHPEIAEAYLHVVRSMNGTSGFPANLILTPTLEPFDGAGLVDDAALHRLLVGAANRWKSEPHAVIAEARANIAKARATAEQRAPSDVDATTLEAVVDDVANAYERTKTIDPITAAFLFRYSARTNHAPLRTLAADALETRAARRVRDQLGGGFHRCDTCYEKLLPDQALMALASTEGWQITGDPDLAHVAKTTLDYVLRDLRAAAPKRGAFDASQDAYSLVPDRAPVNVNGAFYLWTRADVARLVGNEAGAKVAAIYGLGDAPSIPLLAERRFFSETHNELAAPLAKLLDVRQKRPAPFREPLVVAGWNGLMISALARAASAFGEQKYNDAAQLAATAVLQQLWDAKTRTLLHSDSRAAATSDDYALLVQALLDLFDSSHDVRWFDHAIALQSRQDQLFWDASLGRYATGNTLPETLRGLLVEADDALPSANSVAALNLLRLAALTGNETWAQRPAMIFQSFGARLRNDGARLPQLAAAYESSLLEPRIVVVTGDPRKQPTHDLLRSIHARHEPMRAVVFLPHKGAPRERVVKSLPFTGALAPDPQHPVAYVCARGECRRQ